MTTHNEGAINSGHINLVNTDIPAYSDTLGPRQKCHCSQSVTVATYDTARGSRREGAKRGETDCHCSTVERQGPFP